MPFNYYALPSLITAIISLITGIYILRKNPKNELNIVWSFFLFTIVLWAAGEAGIRFSGLDQSAALFWHNIFVLAGGGFMPCVFFHFSLIFPFRHQLRDSRYLLPLVYIAMAGFYVHALIRGWTIEGTLTEVGGSYTRESLTR